MPPRKRPAAAMADEAVEEVLEEADEAITRRRRFVGDADAFGAVLKPIASQLKRHMFMYDEAACVQKNNLQRRHACAYGVSNWRAVQGEQQYELREIHREPRLAHRAQRIRALWHDRHGDYRRLGVDHGA